MTSNKIKNRTKQKLICLLLFCSLLLMVSVAPVVSFNNYFAFSLAAADDECENLPQHENQPETGKEQLSKFLNQYGNEETFGLAITGLKDFRDVSLFASHYSLLIGEPPEAAQALN